MSKQWGHGFHSGVSSGFDEGYELGVERSRNDEAMRLAEQVRAMAVALERTQHRADPEDFYMLLEVLRSALARYIEIPDERWTVPHREKALARILEAEKAEFSF